MKWIVNFREKGENPRIGGFFVVDSPEERDELTNQLKSLDAKVQWEEV